MRCEIQMKKCSVLLKSSESTYPGLNQAALKIGQAVYGQGTGGGEEKKEDDSTVDAEFSDKKDEGEKKEDDDKDEKKDPK